jgi:serine protease Do
MGYDKISDVALLRLSGTGFNKVFEYKDSRTEVKIGDTINTIGYPGGVDNQSISRGIVRDNKSQMEGAVMESIITDISIYGGNSGGPLITDDGKAVGIVSYGYTNKEEINGGVSSYLFVPMVNYYLSQYSTGTVSYPKGYLGIAYDSVNLPVAVILGMSSVEGYYVASLDGTISPSKFNVNDVITEINGVRVGVMNNQFPLFTEIQLRPPGTVISVKYRPNGSWNTELTKNVTLSSFNPNNDYLFSNYRRDAVNIPYL